MMVICGVDPGTHATGYGMLKVSSASASSIAYIAHGTIRPKSSDLSGRLKEIFLGLSDVFRHYQPAEVAIETSFHAVNAQSALKLGHARGAIILAAALMDIPVFEYTPTEVKKATCGYGRADKDQIYAMITTILHLPRDLIASRDASDALAIGVCHSSCRRFKELTQ